MLHTTAKILNFDGSEIITQETKEAFTMRMAIVNALNGLYKEDEGASGSEKMERFKLALKISSNDVVPISLSEIELIEKYILKANYQPLILGRIKTALLAIASKESGIIHGD